MDDKRIKFLQTILDDLFDKGPICCSIIEDLREYCSKKYPDLSNSEIDLLWQIARITPPIIPDYGLPEIIRNYRGEERAKGTKEIDYSEISILVGACRSLQYGRFMLHMMNAYKDPEILGPGDEENKTCPFCGKPLFPLTKWTEIVKMYPGNPEKNEKEFLEISSPKSRTPICLDCLVQLQELIRLKPYLFPNP